MIVFGRAANLPNTVTTLTVKRNGTDTQGKGKIMNVPGIITVRTYYYGPTETNGSRMRAIARLDNGRTRQTTIPYPYAASNADKHVAEQLCTMLGYDTSRLTRVGPSAYVIVTEGCVNGEGECPNACQCGCESGLYECACDE